ncbi:TPA: hypothetical protein I9082_003305 [Clostridium perfringens]|nr:hypothetical protein [Clostridium perfringens]
MKKNLLIIIIFLAIIFSCFYLLYNKNLKNNPKIEQPIHTLLNNFFEIDYGNEPLNYSDVINNKELTELLTLTFNRFKDNVTKNKVFKIKVNNIDEVETNNYLVEFEVFQGEKIDIYTKYIALIPKENERYYINRLINDILFQDQNSKKFILDNKLYNQYIENSKKKFLK